MANYTKVFDNPYPSGWKNLPDESTPISANALQEHTDAIENIEQYLYDNPITAGGVAVVDNLTSTSATDALSANQGRVLKGITDGNISRGFLDDNLVNIKGFNFIKGYYAGGSWSGSTTLYNSANTSYSSESWITLVVDIEGCDNITSSGLVAVGGVLSGIFDANFSALNTFGSASNNSTVNVSNYPSAKYACYGMYVSSIGSDIRFKVEKGTTATQFRLGNDVLSYKIDDMFTYVDVAFSIDCTGENIYYSVLSYSKPSGYSYFNNSIIYSSAPHVSLANVQVISDTAIGLTMYTNYGSSITISGVVRVLFIKD